MKTLVHFKSKCLFIKQHSSSRFVVSLASFHAKIEINIKIRIRVNFRARQRICGGEGEGGRER